MPEMQAETVAVTISGTDLSWRVGIDGVKGIDATSMQTQEGFRIIQVVYDDGRKEMFQVAPLLLVMEIRESKILRVQPEVVNEFLSSREPIDLASRRNGKTPEA